MLGVTAQCTNESAEAIPWNAIGGVVLRYAARAFPLPRMLSSVRLLPGSRYSEYGILGHEKGTMFVYMFVIVGRKAPWSRCDRFAKKTETYTPTRFRGVRRTTSPAWCQTRRLFLVGRVRVGVLSAVSIRADKEG